MAYFDLKHGFAPVVGPGTAVESNIHVMDPARAYVVFFHHMELSSAKELLTRAYYFCECDGDNEAARHDVGAVVGTPYTESGRWRTPHRKDCHRNCLKAYLVQMLES